MFKKKIASYQWAFLFELDVSPVGYTFDPRLAISPKGTLLAVHHGELVAGCIVSARIAS